MVGTQLPNQTSTFELAITDKEERTESKEREPTKINVRVKFKNTCHASIVT
jgi:hypothetical protein